MIADTLRPLGGSNAAHSFAYWGDRAEWLVAAGQHRDSDALERSNFATVAADLATRYPDDVARETFSNWAVGWTEALLVRPGTPAAAAAQAWAAKLAEYPVADDDAYSALELAEEWCSRCDAGTRADHPLSRCPRFRSAEDAREIQARWDARS